MAIRVQLPNSKRPPAKVDQAQTFGDDRTAALARLAAPGPSAASAGPAALSFGRRQPDERKDAPVPPTELRAQPVPAQGGQSRGPEISGMPPAGAATEAGLATSAASSVRDLQPPDSDSTATASEALLNPSSTPALIRAAGLLTKWGVLAAVLLAVAFLATRYLVPLLEELRRPGKAETIADKNAPTAVRIIQQTRAVVAKSDANVSYLNNVVLELEEKKVVAPVAPPAPEVVPKARAPLPARDDLTPYQEAVQRLQLGGVFDGDPPRIYLNGRIVKYAEIIDRDLGLRFIGIDVENKAVLFTNAANVTFKKYY